VKLSLRKAHEALAASPLKKPLLRVAVAIVSVLGLAFVGRAVTAGGAIPPAVASTSSADVPPMIAPPVVPSVDAAPPPPIPMQHAARATADDPVYLNEATVEDLRRLPGIGDKRALAILELRSKLGRFKQVDDLLRVKGIGRSTLKKLRPLVRLARQDGGA
jgi:competence protein ComEA